MDDYKISRLDDNNEEIQRYIKSIAKRAGVNVKDDMECYLMVDNNTNPLAYTLFNVNDRTVIIDWIYAKHGYGTIFFKKLTKIFRRSADKIELKVSIDPNERKEKVIRRMNFYIKNNFRVFDIKYRDQSGPIFSMSYSLK